MLVVALVSQRFRQRARGRARVGGKRLLSRFGVEVLGPGPLGCETKATTNIAFAQGSQTSNSTS